ncbi:uncharacterized protein LOC133199451 [Saccostrea echinata]|uniref:uncharacterized protein LOC133199451 n=1 Tax=Saccostrea echinata TaxID=191078 RepID=UPI002A805178|nr:uncharacterized protein LOC133199451 [Saccostrea echinata]
MKNVLSLLVVVFFAGLCFAQDYPGVPTAEPSAGKCPKEFPMIEYVMKPKPCHVEKPYCPKGLMCCPCPKTGKKYCIRPRMDEDQSTDDSDSFWEELKREFMEHKDDDYDCDDDDDRKEDGDRVYEMDRLAEEEKGHTGMKKHRMRCHHKHRMHKIVRIVAPVVGLIIMVAIAVTVACCIRRRRIRRAAEKARKSVYTPENIAPVPDKAAMKGILGLEFSPEVFVSSEPSYKKLEEEKERI